MDLEKINNIIETTNIKSSLMIDCYFNLIRSVSSLNDGKADLNFNNFYDKILSGINYNDKIRFLKIHFQDMLKATVEIKRSLNNIINIMDSGCHEEIQHCIDYFYVVQKLKIIGLSKNKTEVFSTILSSVIECLVVDIEEMVSVEAIDFAENHVVSYIEKVNDDCLNYVWEYKQESSNDMTQRIKTISKEITENLKIIQKDKKYSVGLEYVAMTIFNVRHFIKNKLDAIKIDSIEMEFKRHMLLKYRLTKEIAFVTYTRQLLVKINLSKTENTLASSIKIVANNVSENSANSCTSVDKNNGNEIPKITTIDEDSNQRKMMLSAWRAKREKERQEKIKQEEEVKKKKLDKATSKVNESIREANVYIVTKEKIDKNQLDFLIEIIAKPLNTDFVYAHFESLMKRLKIEQKKNSDSHIKLSYQGKSAHVWKIHGGDDRMPQIAIDFIVEALWSLGILQGDKDLARGNKNKVRLFLKSGDDEILLHEPENLDKARFAMSS